jgi:hypothetical protein
MYHLGLTTQHTLLHQSLVQSHAQENGMSLKDFTLIISTGLGVSHKPSSDATLIHKRITHDLHTNPPFYSLNKLTALSGENSLSRWAAHSRSSSSTQCNFHDLSYQINTESGVIYLTNLHTILSSSTESPTHHLRHQDTLAVDLKAAFSSSVDPLISLMKSCYADLLATLTLDKEVIDIRLRSNHQTFNDRGKSIVQADTITSLSYPYHNAGLTGTDQIVGVGDTGVDELSCFFSNTDSSLVTRSSYKNPKYDLSKRVVIQYIDYANGGDETQGHGSHVCGTIAGSTSTTINYNGHGVGAKIAFFDMSVSGNSIFYPPPLSKNVFSAAYSAGARLHSNSWGSASNMYDDSCVDIDSYHVTKQDFLAIFAAGNAVRSLTPSPLASTPPPSSLLSCSSCVLLPILS